MRWLIFIFLSLILLVNETTASVYKSKREIKISENRPLPRPFELNQRFNVWPETESERDKLFGPEPIFKGFGYEILPEHEGEDFIPRVLQRDE